MAAFPGNRLLAAMRDQLSHGIECQCEWCGDVFVAHHVNARYCSNACRSQASKARQLAGSTPTRKDN